MMRPHFSFYRTFTLNVDFVHHHLNWNHIRNGFFRTRWREGTIAGTNNKFCFKTELEKMWTCPLILTFHSTHTHRNLTVNAALAITSLTLCSIDINGSLYWDNRPSGRPSLVHHTPCQRQSSQPPAAWPRHQVLLHLQHPCKTQYSGKGRVGCIWKSKQGGGKINLACVYEVECTARSAIVTVDRGCTRRVCWFVNMCWEERA